MVKGFPVKDNVICISLPLDVPNCHLVLYKYMYDLDRYNTFCPRGHIMRIIVFEHKINIPRSVVKLKAFPDIDCYEEAYIYFTMTIINVVVDYIRFLQCSEILHLIQRCKGFKDI